ncbi:MAG: RdgB/HAM1 family non-canonical purine NTP pyrophosphatase [Deltaproteobacteria bacterium]|jgi:XTP/dITP diphosphohydrolase|nr:RdgB/HAM1 family non-canonical purine NTP pyrophosphatase [Deltaproteobacteria bacterium]
MRRHILLATRNKNKAAELETILSGFSLRVLGLDEFPELKEIEETGSSFAENALLKARHACAATGMVTLADDSGLEVEALNGEPGVYSARFYLKHPGCGGAAQNPPERKATDKDAANIACLLERMKNIPEGRRQARFCCAIAAVAPPGGLITAFGAWPGMIALAPAGKYGFGYDPVFWDPELQLTAGQIAPKVKNSRSHRYRALQNLLRLWPGFWAEVSG